MKKIFANLIQINYYVGKKPQEEKGYVLTGFLAHPLQSSIRVKYSKKLIPRPFDLPPSIKDNNLLIGGCIVRINQSEDPKDDLIGKENFGKIGISLIGESKKDLENVAKNLGLPTKGIQKEIIDFCKYGKFI